MSGLVESGLVIVAIMVVGVVASVVGAALQVSRGSRRGADVVDHSRVEERQREMCGSGAGAR